MTAIIFILQKLLVVVWHTDHVKLDHVINLVDSRRVDISVDDSTFMDELYRLNKLPENAKSLYRREWPLAERFPVLHVVGSFLHKHKNSVLLFGCIQEKMIRVET